MKKNRVLKGLALLGLTLGLTGCANTSFDDVFGKAKEKSDEIAKLDANDVKDKAKDLLSRGEKKTEDTGQTSNQSSDEVANLVNTDYKSGDHAIVEVNGNKSTLDVSQWNGPKVEYSNLDSLNRVGPATAHLDKNNLGKSEGRASQKWQPTGWKNQANKINGKKKTTYDRGHLIAYTVTFNLNDDGAYEKGLSGSIDNPKNLFTQTAYSNQTLFQIYERQVRDSLAKGHKVMYKVEPMFRGDELVARGAQMQAKSDDGSLDFNVFVYNAQPNVSIDYATGKTKVDMSMEVVQ